MERIEGAQSAYEVYCFRCRVTFPVESRQCLHCGGPLFGRDERATSADLAPGAAMPVPTGEDAEESPLLMLRRFGGIAIWAIVALAAVLQNLCHRG